MGYLYAIIVIFSILVICLFTFYSNNYIKLTKYDYDKNISNGFDGYKILHVSDLHGDFTTWKYNQLLRRTFELEPDLVVVTGDCIDKIHIKNCEMVLSYLKEVNKRFQLFLVSGNHEFMHLECKDFWERLETEGFNILHNSHVDIVRGTDIIRLYGVDDPYALYCDNMPSRYVTPREQFISLLKQKMVIDSQQQYLSILLSHRPEFFDVYSRLGYHIIFTGHAHGGQWRLPFLGGVIAPDQGMFPKYTAGKYSIEKSTMIVSRGLGNSVIPVRLFNNPELVLLTLHNKI